MTPTPKENKTLADFLESERKEFEEKFVAVYQSPHVLGTYTAWNDKASAEDVRAFLSSHDTRLLEFVREMVKETMDSSDLREKWLKELDTTLTPPTKV